MDKKVRVAGGKNRLGKVTQTNETDHTKTTPSEILKVSVQLAL